VNDAALAAWLAVLDALTYYEILGVGGDATHDEIKAAFHAFAEAFHPDAHATAEEAQRRGVHTIFKRGAEAYRVLQDPASRALYDSAVTRGEVRPLTLSSMRPPPPLPRDGTIQEELVAIGARPFAHRASELAAAGDFAQAKLYVKLALFHDPESATLLAFEEYLRKRTTKA